MSLQDDIEYLKARLFALEDRVKTSPHFRWGTVVTSVPLTIILDGAADALPGTPANAGPKVLMVGERVRVELQGNRAVVHAVGGRFEDLRGTSAERVQLGLSGVLEDGHRFYDTDENREYVWRDGEWTTDRRVHVGATIRRVSTTEWAYIDDTGHTPVGFTSISIVNSNRVRVFYDFTADKVVTFQATVDESFAAAGSGGVRCGASAGLTYTDIYFYMGASDTPVDPGLLSTAGANVWLSGTFLV